MNQYDNKILVEDGAQIFINELMCRHRSQNTLLAYRTDIYQSLDYVKTHYSSVNYVDDISTDILSDFRQYLFLDKNLQKSSVNRKLDVLNAMFAHLLKTNCIKYNPVTELLSNKLSKRKQRLPLILTYEEIDKIISSVRDNVYTRNRDQTIIKLLAYCGIGRTEALNLDWKDIDLHKEKLSITRDTDVIYLPLNSIVIEALMKLYKSHRPNANDPVFRGYKGERLAPTTFNSAFKYAVENSGIKRDRPITSHSLQSSFCYDLIKNGGNIIQAAEYTGHKDLNQLKIFNDLVAKERKKV